MIIAGNFSACKCGEHMLISLRPLKPQTQSSSSCKKMGVLVPRIILKLCMTVTGALAGLLGIGDKPILTSFAFIQHCMQCMGILCKYIRLAGTGFWTKTDSSTSQTKLAMSHFVFAVTKIMHHKPFGPLTHLSIPAARALIFNPFLLALGVNPQVSFLASLTLWLEINKLSLRNASPTYVPAGHSLYLGVDDTLFIKRHRNLLWLPRLPQCQLRCCAGSCGLCVIHHWVSWSVRSHCSCRFF